jgi:hypothetical protein
MAEVDPAGPAFLSVIDRKGTSIRVMQIKTSRDDAAGSSIFKNPLDSLILPDQQF